MTGILDPYLAAAAEAERIRGLPPGSVQGILAGEATPPGVVSSAGAITPLQVLPSTARAMNMDPRFLAQNPGAATNAGAAYLAQQYQKFGNLPDAYAAYNAGPGGAQAWIGAGRPASFPVQGGDIGQYANRASAAQGGTQMGQASQTLQMWDAIDSPSAGKDAAAPAATGESQTLQMWNAADKPAAPALGATVTPAPPNVQEDKSYMGGAQAFMAGLYNNFLGAVQHTDPITSDLMGGRGRYGDPIGRAVPSDNPAITFVNEFGGKIRDFDPMKDVVLYDPNGQALVYRRTPETNISNPNAIGHALMLPTMTGPIGAAGGGAGQLARSVGQFDRAGVAPDMASASGNTLWQMARSALGDLMPSGGVVRRGVQQQLQQAAKSVERIAGAYGEAGNAADAGKALEQGAASFKAAQSPVPLADLSQAQRSAIVSAPTRASSFAQKSGVLYDNLDKLLPPGTSVPMANTAEAFGKIGSRFDSPELKGFFADPQFAKFKTAIEKAGGALSWNDARNLRTQIGKQLAKPTIMQDQDIGDLKALYSSLTKDLQGAAGAVPGGLQALNRADAYYQAGAQRLTGALKELLSPSTSSEAAFGVLERAGTAGAARANAAKLTAIRRSIPNDQWGDVAASVLSKLGEPKPGVADVAPGAVKFSQNSFVTNWAKLSDTAKESLFGAAGSPLRNELDNLVGVIGRMKNADKFNSTSHSANVTQAMLWGGAFTQEPMSTALAAASANAGARALMSPTFVHWMASLSGIKTPADAAAKLATLGQLTKFEPDLLPVFRALSAPAQDQQPQAK